jgi:hypothetical protein
MHSVSYHLDVQELKYKKLKSRNSILFFFFFPTESTGTEFGDWCRQLTDKEKKNQNISDLRGFEQQPKDFVIAPPSLLYPLS